MRTAGITWLSYNSQWDLAVKHWALRVSVETFDDIEIKPFYQHYTFFQCNNNDCAPAERPLLRFRHKDAPIYPDQIRVPSWRQLNGDKRAAPGGKVPRQRVGVPASHRQLKATSNLASNPTQRGLG